MIIRLKKETANKLLQLLKDKTEDIFPDSTFPLQNNRQFVFIESEASSLSSSESSSSEASIDGDCGFPDLAESLVSTVCCTLNFTYLSTPYSVSFNMTAVGWGDCCGGATLPCCQAYVASAPIPFGVSEFDTPLGAIYGCSGCDNPTEEEDGNGAPLLCLNGGGSTEGGVTLGPTSAFWMSISIDAGSTSQSIVFTTANSTLSITEPNWTASGSGTDIETHTNTISFTIASGAC